jgi:hypothetical protein
MTPLLAHGSASASHDHKGEPHSISSSEYAQIAAGRLMYLPSWGLFLASLLVASLTEIVWITHPWMDPMHCCHIAYPKSKLFFAVETYLTLGLIFETGLRFVWQRRSFWLHWGNWFDVGVCGMSTVSFFLYWWHTSADIEAIVLVIMVAWLVLRVARLTAIVAKIRERRRLTMDHLDVAFPEEDEEPGDGDTSLNYLGLRRGCSPSPSHTWSLHDQGVDGLLPAGQEGRKSPYDSVV